MLATDPVTQQDAVAILGCSAAVLSRLVTTGRLPAAGDDLEPAVLSRLTVEHLASEIYPWRRHLHEPASYWITGADAATVLGVSQSRLNQLAATRRVPFVRHEDRTRLYRRAELEQMSQRAAG